MNTDKIYAEQLANEYAPKDTSKVVTLRKLDAKAKRPASVFTYTFGIIGFCKVDAAAGSGKIDYLVVLPEHRGRGCGTGLMDWAMQVFRQRGINSIEVKVAAGNDAIRLDEKYGFQRSAQILRLDR